jgi:hypothetical protein
MGSLEDIENQVADDAVHVLDCVVEFWRTKNEEELTNENID